MPSVLIAILQTSAGQLVNALALFALSAWLVSSSTSEQYGIYALCMTAQVMIQQVISAPIGQSILRCAAGKPPAVVESLRHETAAMYLDSCTKLCPIAIITTLSVYLTGRTLSAFTLVSCVLTALIAGTVAFEEAYAQARQERASVATIQCLHGILRLLSAVAMVEWFGANSVQLAFSQLLGTIVVAMIVIPRQTKWLWVGAIVRQSKPGVRLPDTPNQLHGPELAVLYRPLALSGVISFLQLSSDRYVVALVLNAEKVGILVGIQQLLQAPLQLVFNTFLAYIAPIVYAEDTNRNITKRGNCGSVIGLSAITVASIGLAMSIAVHLAIPIFTHERLNILKNAPAYLCVAIIASTTVSYLTQVASFRALKDRQPAKLLLPKLTSVLATYSLSLLLACRYELYAPIIASILGSAIFLLTYWAKTPRSRLE